MFCCCGIDNIIYSRYSSIVTEVERSHIAAQASMTKIQWTDKTSNPIHLVDLSDNSHGGHHCRKISPGCANCYAEEINNSNYFNFASHLKYSGKMPSNTVFDDRELKSWTTPKQERIFVCSMTDFCLEETPNEWLDKMICTAVLNPQKTFQFLTKRPHRLKQYLEYLDLSNQPPSNWLGRNGFWLDRTFGYNKLDAIVKLEALWETSKLPPNIWVGVTAENQQCAEDRIPLLLKIPASVRFLSCEPLLEPLDLLYYLPIDRSLPDPSLGLHWAIVGGESGSKARSCKVEWFVNLVEQFEAASVPVFFKQFGYGGQKWQSKG